jgi:uncharacterized membrane protein YhiD involved in acid resistance
VLQGLIAGIGFLVAGAILKQQDTEQIHGLTTAAGLWLTASVGCGRRLGTRNLGYPGDGGGTHHPGSAASCQVIRQCT